MAVEWVAIERWRTVIFSYEAEVFPASTSSPDVVSRRGLTNRTLLQRESTWGGEGGERGQIDRDLQETWPETPLSDSPAITAGGTSFMFFLINCALLIPEHCGSISI